MRLGEKQTIFWKRQWALRRTDGRYANSVTRCVWVWHTLLTFQKRRLESLPERGFMTLKFFGEALLSGRGFQDLKCLPRKTIPMPKRPIGEGSSSSTPYTKMA